MLKEFIANHIDWIDAGDFDSLISKSFILDKLDLDEFVAVLSETFPEEAQVAFEKHLADTLEDLFIKHHIELPLNITDFIEDFYYHVVGYDKFSLAEYIRKNGLKYGIKLVDNPVYGEPFITYVKKV